MHPPDSAARPWRAADPVSIQDADAALPGAVLMVPDTDWGISSLHREDHPGACVGFDLAGRHTTFVQGRTARDRHHHGYYLIEPTPGNGLSARTAFSLAPRPLRWSRVRNFFPDRLMGHLEPAELAALRAALECLFPAE